MGKYNQVMFVSFSQSGSHPDVSDSFSVTPQRQTLVLPHHLPELKSWLSPWRTPPSEGTAPNLGKVSIRTCSSVSPVVGGGCQQNQNKLTSDHKNDGENLTVASTSMSQCVTTKNPTTSPVNSQNKVVLLKDLERKMSVILETSRLGTPNE